MIPLRYASCFDGLQFINRPKFEVKGFGHGDLVKISQRELREISFTQNPPDSTDYRELFCIHCDEKFGIIYKSDRYPNKKFIEYMIWIILKIKFLGKRHEIHYKYIRNC